MKYIDKEIYFRNIYFFIEYIKNIIIVKNINIVRKNS